MIFKRGILIVLFYATQCINADTKVDAIKKELVTITKEIQEIEAKFDGSTQKLITNIENESQAIEKINTHQFTLSHTLQQASSFVKRSPLILLIMPVSVSDVIHAYMIMNSAIPQIQKKKNHILTSLKSIQDIRSSRNTLKQHQNKTAQKYEKLRARQDQLLFQKTQLLKFRNFPRNHDKNQSLQSTLFGLIDVLKKGNPSKFQSKVSLLKPVITSLIHPSENNPLTQALECRPSAQVVSPLKATVIYASYDPSGHHAAILQSGPFYLILSGLGSLSCHIGEVLLAGEPLGRMPSFNNENKQAMSVKFTRQLHVEMFKGNQQIDPSPYFS